MAPFLCLLFSAKRLYAATLNNIVVPVLIAVLHLLKSPFASITDFNYVFLSRH